MALTQDPGNLITDPLALRFMTGEQMGYMPEAQYLTPSEYGAFRTLPGPRGHNYLNQDPGFLQSLLIRSRGSLGFLPNYTFNTYNPAVNLQQYMYHMRTRSDDSLMAGVGVGADMAASMGVGMLLGGVPGLAAGMLMPDISKPLLDRIRDMRGIQNMSMSKIVAGSDMNQVTGMGFNAASARKIDSFLRMQSADDVLLKQGDWRKLLQMGIEHGQFDYAGNAEQYKEALKKLRKSITTVMEVAGSTDFKDIMKEYKRMRTMGAGLSQYTDIMRKEDLYSRVAGMSHADMVNTYGQQGALIYQQSGLTGYQGSLQAMHNAASITLMQRTGLLTPGALSRYGGISGMSQTMTQQDAVAQNRIADFMLPYFMKEDASGLDDSASLSDLLNSNDPLGMLGRAAGRKTHTLEQKMRFDHNRGDLMQKFQERYGQEIPTASLALKMGHQVRLKGTEALEYGYRQLGFDQNIAYFKAKSFISNDFREQEERELQLARRKLREERELADSPFRKLARSLDKTFTRWGENVFGGVANWYAGWSERSAMNADGNFRIGGGMPNSPDWQSRVNIDTSFPSPQKGPVPHPVENLEALAAPAEKALSGGDAGKVAWSKKDGTKYGLFAFTPERMQEFADWMKTRGSEGQYWAKEFEEAGGFKNFNSADEAKNSKIAEVMARFGANERTQAQLRKYVYEKYYQPSLEAMESAKRAELMASEAGQKMLYMEAAQGEVIIDKSGGGFDPNVKIGDTIAHEESGTEGVYKIGHDRTGGTSYGKWQLSSTNAKGGEGSYQGWLRFLDEKGGKWAGVASRLRSAGPLNTGSRRGAAVDAYKAELKGNEREIEDLQREYLLGANYAPAMEGIKSATLRTMIEQDRSLKEMVFSTAVQHGGAGAADVINKAYKEGMSREEIIRAVYAERGAPGRFKSSTKKVQEAVRERFSREAELILGMNRGVIKSTATTIIEEAMQIGGGKITPDVIAKVIDRHRKNAGEDKEQLAILDKVEHGLKGSLNEDYARRSGEDEQQRALEDMRKQIESEAATVDDKIFGSLRHERERGRAGKNGRSEDQIEVPQIMQNLNRYESGLDMVGGTVNWDSVADTLSSAIGKNEKGEPKFKASDLSNAIQENSSTSILRGVRNEQASISYAKKILENKELGLSKEDVEKAAQDPVIRAMFYAAGMRSINPGDASEIHIEHTRWADQYAKGERHNQLAAEQRFYKQYTDDSFETNLPGVSKLGKDYDDAKKELFKRAYEGDESTPYILKAARLFLLKNLVSKPGVGGAYKEEFIIEAKKLGFDEKWIAMRLAESRGMIADDMKGSPLLANLKAEDIDNIQKINQGLLAEDSNYAENKHKDLITKYNEGLVHNNALLLKSEAVLVKGQNMTALESYAYRVGIDKDKLLKPEGMKELQRRVIEGRIASKWDMQVAQKVLKKYRDTGVVSVSDFLMSGARSGMEDGTTHTALNNPLKGEEVWEQARREEMQRHNPPLQQQQSNKEGEQGQNSPGSPLDDSTVKKLNEVLLGLKGVLERWEHTPLKVKLER